MTRKLDYSDYAAIPDDGNRYEVLDGVLYRMPRTTPAHQRTLQRLFLQIEPHFEERGLGEVFLAPVDVILTPHDIVQPDLIVAARPEQVSVRGVEGTPLLAVEILLAASREHDRDRKAARYAALGIPHFWIVDPDERQLECYRWETGAYLLVASGEHQASATHPDWTDLLLELATLWR